jgi:hypothetical protein
MTFDVLSPNENFRGMSYGEWASVWNNWLLSTKPVYDGGKMLFLRGNIDYRPVGKDDSGPRFLDPKAFYDRTNSRGETVFQGTAILVPVVTASLSISDTYDGRVIENEQQLRYFVNKDIDEGGPVWARIMNLNSRKTSKIVEDLLDFRVESSVFKLTIPTGSPLNRRMEKYAKSGIYDTVVGGYFLLIRSLPISRYRITFGGKGRGPYYTNAIYDISIIRNPRDNIEDLSFTARA